ncbi:MAG: nuclear transport factor 2 family protein [Myxococcota bacterium]|nr:nuclear transport factor 2 family protein [Myxococcota bacterium]
MTEKISAVEMQTTLERYLERVRDLDVTGVVALMAEDVSVEDPVGGPPGTHVVGRTNVERFFTKGFANSRPCPRLNGTICTTEGNEAALPFVLELDLFGKRSELDVIDVVRFNSSGEIQTLRAFWNIRLARPARHRSQPSP